MYNLEHLIHGPTIQTEIALVFAVDSDQYALARSARGTVFT